MMMGLSYQDLELITNNFNEANLLGTGYRWKVYRGIALQGKDSGEPLELTIKLWSKPNDEDIKYFEDEMRLLTCLKLSHLVIIPKLFGYCCEERILALVFEVASMNTVHDKLCDGAIFTLEYIMTKHITPIEQFQWILRTKAALEIARGLAFLHQLDPPFILRNFHPANIMLDKDFKPKLFDFGLGSGGMFGDRTGAYGHVFGLDEYKNFHVGFSGAWSTETDVFDFGILLLALGAMTTVPNEENIHLIHDITMNDNLAYVDPDFVKNGIGLGDLYEIADLGMQCVKLSQKKLCSVKQPSMNEVVAYLEELVAIKKSVWHERGMKHPESMYIGFPKFEYPSSLSLKDLKFFTDSLCKTNLLDYVNALGHLSLGKVYRGRMIKKGQNCETAQEVTVKIWNEPDRDVDHFEDELMCLTLPCMSSHPNLVKLIGYCKEDGMLGMVYDLAPMDTLRKKTIDVNFLWSHRIKAAFGIARALDFLHGQHPPFLHRNLDPAHIMLDKDFNPIFFELAMGSGGALGNRLRSYRYSGSYGFADPAYLGTTWTPSCDIYSFGLILLALIACRMVISRNPPEPHILRWVDKQKPSIVHERFQGTRGYYESDAGKVVKLALSCVKYKIEERPKSMKEVVKALEGLRIFQKLPFVSGENSENQMNTCLTYDSHHLGSEIAQIEGACI